MDKNEFDHKSADVIYDAVKNYLPDSKVSENVMGAVVKATVNASNGQLVSLKIEWNVKVDMKFTYSLISVSAKATGISHVIYSDFRY